MQFSLKLLFLLSTVCGNIIELNNFKLGEKVVQKKNRFVFTDSDAGTLENARVDFDLSI